MTVRRGVTLQLTGTETAHLNGLLQELRDLLSQPMQTPDTVPEDAAIARLVPDAYSDDPTASREFRALTATDLLHHRDADARTVAAALDRVAPVSLDDQAPPATITLTADDVEAWLRTLTALRLVLASRLHITSEADHRDDDPRFSVYEWLGYRLDALVRAADEAGV